MKRLFDALFSVTHLWIAFFAVWFGMAFVAMEATGLVQPDYRRLLFGVILAYWGQVTVQLGFFRRRKARQ
ncbi:hypothetical protein [Sphingobium chlorophenolicum]|uniref:Uncharacterized protein n=1 Tax=Sphingobium chlorophenolicum TaxID=46429 RepID=A0A081RG75_SPHCR|nr:hypothetical protein [Sphingobium chlorophenolicum]KEQ54198.1 hypothetical protein BV95_01486 [Sphingobium chlorophenolicum]